MNLEAFGVVELSQDETAQVDGGWIIIAAVVAGAVIYAVADYLS